MRKLKVVVVFVIGILLGMGSVEGLHVVHDRQRQEVSAASVQEFG
jgi:hypothetical protein